MPRNLPTYEVLVRWSVKDVTDWLREVNLTDFKDQFTKNNIDGSRLTRLTDFDVDNFVAKSKKKTELKNYLFRVEKPKNTKSKPSWIPPPVQQNNSKSKESHDDVSDDDSIYSWGSDDFSEGGSDEDDDDNVDSDGSDYIEPALEPIHDKGRRRPQPSIPSNIDNRQKLPTPLLPGQVIGQSSRKKVPQPPVPSNNDDMGQAVYEDPDEGPVVNKGALKKRRPPPPPPPPEDEPEQPNYMNDEDLERERKKSVGKSGNNKEDDGYIKFKSSLEEPSELYIYPEDSEPPQAQAQSPKKNSLPDITIPPDAKSSVKRKKEKPLPPNPAAVAAKRQSSSSDSSKEDELLSYDWYHGDLERQIAETGLKENKYDGMFLIRTSAKGGQIHPYTLMLFYRNKVFNFPVRRQLADGHYALGKESKTDDQTFATVADLIKYFQKNRMILNPAKQGYSTTLTKPFIK